MLLEKYVSVGSSKPHQLQAHVHVHIIDEINIFQLLPR